MENPSIAPRSTGNFTTGFFNGAKSGALMMGIFSSLTFLASLTPLGIPFTLSTSLIMLGLGTVSTGLFSGYMATTKAHPPTPLAKSLAQPAERTLVRAPEQAVSLALQPSSEPSTAWADRVGTRSNDRISEILASKADAADRASAILAAREQADSANAR